MTELKKEQRPAAAPLFKNFSEMMVRACLAGETGSIHTDSEEHPACARMDIDVFSIFAGDATSAAAHDLIESLPQNAALLIPDGDGWAHLLANIPGVEKSYRYAFELKKDFDTEHLKSYISVLPAGFELRDMDSELFEMCKREQWSADLCMGHDSFESFSRYGLGVIAMHNGKPASAASSFASCAEGIEIEVDTIPGHRRKGLAIACSAALILRCMERGIYPGWDAAHLGSAAMAQKLGYGTPREYVIYKRYSQRSLKSAAALFK